jgi:hypothetical protein
LDLLELAAGGTFLAQTAPQVTGCNSGNSSEPFPAEPLEKLIQPKVVDPSPAPSLPPGLHNACSFVFQSSLMGNIGSHVNITSGWLGHQAKRSVKRGIVTARSDHER